MKLLGVTQVAEAAALLVGSATGTPPRRGRLWAIDCEAFYRRVGRQRGELWRNAVCLPQGWRLDERCCFGDASAAVKCTRISDFLSVQIKKELLAFDERHPSRDPVWLAWQAERCAAAAARGASAQEAAAEASLNWFGLYIDDGTGASADDLLYDAEGVAVVTDTGEHMRRATAHFDYISTLRRPC